MIKLDHKVGAVLGGFLFAVGWWILIDGAIYGSKIEVPKVTVDWYCYIPAVFISICVVMINLVSIDDLSPQAAVFADDGVSAKVKMWLFLWFSLACGAIAGAVAIMAVKYSSVWTGWAILIQPVLVFASAVVLLVARRTSTEEGSFQVM